MSLVVHQKERGIRNDKILNFKRTTARMGEENESGQERLLDKIKEELQCSEEEIQQKICELMPSRALIDLLSEILKVKPSELIGKVSLLVASSPTKPNQIEELQAELEIATNKIRLLTEERDSLQDQLAFHARKKLLNFYMAPPIVDHAPLSVSETSQTFQQKEWAHNYELQRALASMQEMQTSNTHERERL
jgi:hypothetical protein